jgi:hypothetical protein
MVAWTILCIFIGTAVPVGSAGPTTFTPSFHFSTCIYSAQEIRRGRCGRTSWFGRTTKDFPNKTNELQTGIFERLHLSFFNLKRGNEIKAKESNYCDETQLKRKERKLVGTYLDGNLSPQADFKNKANSRVVVDTGSMTRKDCSLLESLLAWWWW